jgi:pre-mRNA-splicing factor RBM22/SLT11
LFVTGVEDDLPEHAIRAFFTPFGTLRSIICSHRSHCAFINYATREGAEAAAAACQGRAVILGCPLRVQWGRPKPLDSMDQNERMALARQGRDTAAAVATANGSITSEEGGPGEQSATGGRNSMVAIAPPPGQDDVTYASLAGD